MNSKEKAKELFDRMYVVMDIQDGNLWESAKQCALIAVNEISKNCYEVMKPFWEEVKQEIEKL